MSIHKIIITGGPSSGKTTLIEHLNTLGAHCFEEVSREIIRDAQQAGIHQLFLTDAIAFSNTLLKKRKDHFLKAQRGKVTPTFFDRGIPDIIAYLNYKELDIPTHFLTACHQYKYDSVFILPPWESIYTTDQERYETFEEATQIHHHLIQTYTQLGYSCITVPKDTVAHRSQFILQKINVL